MSAGQGIGAVVGGAVGFFVGGPTGALFGAQIGSTAGGYLDPPKGPTIEGPRLNDLAVQTSTYGAFIPRVYGAIGIHGNLLWLENNQLKETVRKKKQGGKGGGSKTTVKTYSYSATFILALCQGPIAGVRRIWCGDKLIYNAGSDDLETIIASNQAASGWKLYLGSDDQLPDSRYEADVGVGNASAFRGIAYLAFYDFQLADYSNTLQAAQFKVEVVGSATYQAVELQLNDSSGILDPFLPGRLAQSLNADTDGPVHSAFLDPDALSPSTNVGPLSVLFRNPDGQLSTLKVLTSHVGDSNFIGMPIEIPCTLEHSIALLALTSSDVFGVYGDRFQSYTVSGFNNGDLRQVRESGGKTWIHVKEVATSYIGVVTPNPFIPAPIEIVKSGFIQMPAADHSANSRLMVSGDDVYLVRRSSFSATEDFFISVWNGSAWDVHVVPYNRGFGISLSTGCATISGGFLYIFSAYKFNFPLLAVLVKISLDDFSLEEVATFPIAGTGATGVTRNMSISGSIIRTTGITLIDRVLDLSTLAVNDTQVSDVITAEVEWSSVLSGSDVDASGILDSCRGYRVTGGTIRAALEPLQGAFPFDVIPSGYQIKCVPRGQASVATIPWEDLGATDGDEPGDVLQQSREMDTQLPARTNIKYLDAAREYATSEQYAERINTEAINRVDRELPLVLTADEAAGVAEVLQNLAWLERNDYSFTLPPTYLHLEPADVVTVDTPQAVYQLRLTEVNYTPDGRLECEAKPNRAALYTPNASGGEGVAPDGTIGVGGPTAYQLLDIPVVDETLQDAPGLTLAMTGYTTSWPGGILFRSSDEGQTWTDLQAMLGKCTFGYAGAAMPARSGTMIDRGSTLTVSLLSGELESITEAQMLVGANYAAYGVNGRWEIIRFQNATLNADGSYTLDTFVRGDRGTEQYTGTHQTGDVFVLLDDPDNAFVNYPTALLGVPMTYRGITSGASIDTGTDQTFTYQGVNLECLSPVDARGSRDGSSNFTGSFYRRSRLSSSWWSNGVEAPVGEAAQSYEIDVMNGANVVRTIAASTPSFSYTAAQQTTDFGSTQAAITFRIFQISAAVGRGYQYQVTL